MRNILPIKLLIACLALASCGDSSGIIVTDRIGPDAPINEPDTSIFNPGEPKISDETVSTGTGGHVGSTSEVDPTTGGQTGNPSQGGNSKPGEEPESGTEGGQPVPEPGTLLLVGSGLAGISSRLFWHRRRRQRTADAT